MKAPDGIGMVVATADIQNCRQKKKKSASEEPHKALKDCSIQNNMTEISIHSGQRKLETSSQSEENKDAYSPDMIHYNEQVMLYSNNSA